MMAVDIFDERICILGESPQAFGIDNSEISWVDIVGSRVLTRDLKSGEISEFATDENVGFALRRSEGGFLLGTNSGPILRDPDGTTRTLFSLQEIDANTISHSVRWNDAKVSPDGNLFLGTMGYQMLEGTSTLFRYSPTTSELAIALPNLTISNGMDWSDDGSILYFIDSRTQAVSAYSVENDDITFQQHVITVSPDEGAPDGMCMDSEGGIWVALWGGSEVRRYDSFNNFQLTEKIRFSVPFVTSCAFAGAKLDTLIITSATDGLTGLPPESGMTFAIKPGVKGRPSRPINLSIKLQE